MKFSIIIPVYNGQETIKLCLDALLNQDYPKKDYEIIVINDCSTDKTKDILERYAKRIKVIDLKKNIGGIRARELGAKKAKYDTLALLDAYCIAKKDWLLTIKKADYQPLIGECINDKHRGSIDYFFYLFRKKYYKQFKKPVFVNKKNFGRMGKGVGNFVCSKKLFLEFSPKKKNQPISGDILLFYNLLKKKKILKHPGVIVTHLERTNHIKLLKQWFSRGMTSTDFYLIKTKKRYPLFILSNLTVLLLFWIAIFFPRLIILEVLSIILLYGAISIYFIESIKEFFIFFPHIILISVPFYLGMMKRKGFASLIMVLLIILAFIIKITV